MKGIPQNSRAPNALAIVGFACVLAAGCSSGLSTTTASPVPAPIADPVPNATVPPTALMKYQPTGTTNYVFNSSVMLAPPVYPADASATIQSAINAIANASLSKGGVIFLAPGTYLLKNTLKLEGTGVTLVGVRATTATGANGAYPTLEYDDTLVDSDYNNRATIEATVGDVPLLDQPAAIRFNANTDYSASQTYSYGGLIGLNISFVGTTGSGSEGDLATGLAAFGPHQVLFRDLTISNSADGVDVGPCTSPYFRNLTISNFRGSFGGRFGDSTTTAFKIHGVTITAASSNTTATLVVAQQNLEVIGANLTGGAIGLNISGASSSTLADDIYIRSVQIQNTAQQGVLVNFARSTYLNDITVDHAGAESLKVLSGFFGELAVTNFTSTYAGLSAVRVQRGMNVNIANATLLNSGQRKGSAMSSDLPIAGLSIDSSVTSTNITGAKIGDASGTTPKEDWGVYVSTATPAYAPWHTPSYIATSIDFPNLPTAQQVSGITVSNTTSYSTLLSAGYFNAPLEDSWTTQGLPTDPVMTGVQSVVKGFNSYDLPEIRDRQWINLASSALSSAPVVDSSGNLSPANFAYWEGIAATQFPEGVVFYLPSGTFNSSFTSYTRKIYNLAGTLIISQPKIQFVGDGRSITQIYNQTATPTASLIELTSGSTGSGVFGMTTYYDKTAALTAPGTAVTYAPPYLVQNTSQIRLSNIGANYSMGGGVSIVDTTNSELFDTDMNAEGVNNTQPTVPLGVYTITATTNESTSDIRFYETFGEFLENIWMPSSSSFCTDNIACSMNASQIPDFEWVRLIGGVTRFRLDSGTFIEGKNGYVAVSNTGGTAHELSSFKWATDHVYTYGIDLRQASGTVDFVEPWMNARVGMLQVESGVTANLRYSAAETRNAAFEGVLIQGGGSVSLVNDHIGNNGLLSTPYNASQTRPLSGVYVGSGAGMVTLVGGVDGWLSASIYTNATINGNDQNWGLVLGTGVATSHYNIIGTDLYGNRTGRIGQQTSGGTGATVLVP